MRSRARGPLLYVTSTFPYGTREAFLAAELTRIQEIGFEVVIAPTRPEKKLVADERTALAVHAIRAPLFSRRIAFAALGEVCREPRRTLPILRTLSRSRNVPILLKNLAVLPKGLWLAGEIRKRNIAHVHAHWGSTPSTLALIAAEKAGIEWSVTLHRWDIREDNLLAEKVRRAAWVRTISEEGAVEVRERTNVDRQIVMHMGVELAPPAPPKHRVGLPRVLVVANLVRVKGHMDLLKALRKLRDSGLETHVDLVGDGPERDAIEDQVRKLGLSDVVTLCGYVPHNVLLDRLAAGEWQLVVLASATTADGETEGIPVALMEAMSRGVPVVATDTGAVRELLADGAGLLVPQRDSDLLADAMRAVLQSADLQQRLSQAGRERIAERFDIAKITRDLVGLFFHSDQESGSVAA